MEIRGAIYGRIAKTINVPNRGLDVIEIERQRLLSRLLFFDEVVIDSVNLGEVPFLTKMFGTSGLKELLRAGVLKLASETSMIVTDVKTNGVRQLPLLQFDEGIATVQNDAQNLERKFQSLRKITGLSNAERENLRELIQSKLVWLSPTYGEELLKQVRKDLNSNIDLMKTILQHKVPDLNVSEVQIAVHDLGGMQRFETNLQARLNISVEQEHEFLSQIVAGVCNINQRIATMAEYRAISQFEGSEAPLLFGRIHSLVSPANPATKEEAFLRVIKVTDLPKFIESKRIDVAKLLEIRDAAECREFRAWLSTTDSIDDAKLKKIISGFRAKAASFIASGSGKAIRLAVNTGLGLIPGYGTVAAVGEGIVDTFLLDKMLPSSGVLSFLNDEVPSVFSTSQ
jgi:hypothetical protein